MLEKQIQELNYQLEDDQRSYEAALNDRDAQIRKMREECQALMVELQMLLDTKQVNQRIIILHSELFNVSLVSFNLAAINILVKFFPSNNFYCKIEFFLKQKVNH